MISNRISQILVLIAIALSSAIPNVNAKIDGAGALVLTKENFDLTLASHELVFVNYYANWCRFSQMLEPIFDDFANKFAASENKENKIAIGKVDCDVQKEIASKNGINKYPSLKLYRYGVAIKKEFRGARSAEAFTKFIKEQLENPLKTVSSNGEFEIALNDLKKQAIVAVFPQIGPNSVEQSQAYKTFAKLSSILRDSCQFVAGIGSVPQAKEVTKNLITFRDHLSADHTETSYPGTSEPYNYEQLYAWAHDKCTPLVREITFENAEELTEEALPFLILFHKPEDKESQVLQKFTESVRSELASHHALKGTVNAVYADGKKFSHPLSHLGKGIRDLPVLAIDSFRHMYVFPGTHEKMFAPGAIGQFVQDLHSGKLHREFHQGPDPTQPPQLQIENNNGGQQHIPIQQENNNQPRGSTPPESAFVKLGPSPERYSLKLEDEL